MNETDVQIAEILDGWKIYDGIYKRDLINQAVERKDQITPYLIEILETALANPEDFIKSFFRFDNNYALILLGHFKEPRAHKVIVDIFSLPDEIPFDLFGDLVTDDLPTLLLNTCGGSVDLIRALVLNPAASGSCRDSAAEALTYAVVDGIVSRQEVLEFFCGLFTGTEDEPGSLFWSAIAGCVLNLYPEESMDTIKKAYDDGLINDGFIAYDDFLDVLKGGKKKCLEILKADIVRSSLNSSDDIHTIMSGWVCFKQDEPKDHPIDHDPSSNLLSKHRTKSQKKKKKKRKMTKKSRRKNR